MYALHLDELGAAEQVWLCCLFSLASQLFHPPTQKHKGQKSCIYQLHLAEFGENSVVVNLSFSQLFNYPPPNKYKLKTEVFFITGLHSVLQGLLSVVEPLRNFSPVPHVVLACFDLTG